MMCSRVASDHDVSIRQGVFPYFFTIVVTCAFRQVSEIASRGIQCGSNRKGAQCNLNSRQKAKVFSWLYGICMLGAGSKNNRQIQTFKLPSDVIVRPSLLGHIRSRFIGLYKDIVPSPGKVILTIIG